MQLNIKPEYLISIPISIVVFASTFYYAHSDTQLQNTVTVAQIQQKQAEHGEKIKSLSYVIYDTKNEVGKSYERQEVALQRLQDSLERFEETSNNRIDNLQQQMVAGFQQLNKNIQNRNS